MSNQESTIGEWDRIAERLVAIKAVKVSVDPPVTHLERFQSPIYIDCRRILGDPETRVMVVERMAQLAAATRPDVISGIETAGIGWGAMVADCLRLPFAYLRKNRKGYGTMQWVEGADVKGRRVAVIDDLLFSGDTMFEMIDKLREDGCIVDNPCVVLNYELLQGLQKASAREIAVNSVTTFRSVLSVASQHGIVDEHARREIEIFIADPDAWAPPRKGD